MDSLKCAICGEIVADDKHYFRKHNLKMADYFEKYYPRKDLLTNEPIRFKSKERYFVTDFADKINLKKYLKSCSLIEAQAYCKEFLKRRATVKQLKYTPSQVELRTICSPTIIFFDKTLPQGYNAYCEEIGLITKFKILGAKIDLPPVVPAGKIIIDTREQNPHLFKTPCEIKKLDYGDYHFTGNQYNIFVERKNLNDFIGTLGKNYERFLRELDRAKKDDAKIIVLVEEELAKCLSFNHLPWIKRFVRDTPEHVFHNVREIMQNYDNVQFLFVDGRTHAGPMLNKIFFSKTNFFSFDNQLAYETKLI